MMDFFSGALTMAYVIAGVFFLRFWKKTHDRLFCYFAVAFWLFAINQLLATALSMENTRVGYLYMLRVAGFLLILYAIIDKNAPSGNKPRR